MTKPIIDLAPFSAQRALSRAPANLSPGVIRMNQADDGASAEVMVFGDIGGWWEDSVSASEFAKELSQLDVETLNVRVNSPGGVVFDGVAIYNALAAHPAKVIVTVEGIAASIASIIAMAGDEIRIGAASNIMIHKPWSWAMGDADAMIKEAEVLNHLEDGLIDIYKARTGAEEDDIRTWVAAETWFRGQQAVDAGFADVLVPAKSKAKASHRSTILNLYQNTPEELRHQDETPAVRELERLLRDVEKLPQAFAKRIAALAQKVLPSERDVQTPDPRDEDGQPAGAVQARLELAAHIRSMF